MFKGIDVSEFQSNVNWDEVRKNIDFAILRLGWVGNNRFQKDKRFEEYYSECKRLEIPIGIYVYNYAGTKDRMVECAKWVVEQLNGKTIELPIYLDMEDASIAPLGKEALTDICIAFNSEIESAGYWAGVYANLNWFNNFLNKETIKEKYTTWIAHYGVSQNRYNGEYDILQYTSDGNVPGINGRVDMNVMYRDLMDEIENSKQPNKEKFDFLGINRFHKAGFLGQGVIVASREGTTSKHGAMVADIIKQVAPMATLILKENYQKGTDADIYTTSLFYASDKIERHHKTAQSLYDRDVFLCCAVGNDGNSLQTSLSKVPCWTSIGAYDLVNGEPKKMYYSSVTDDIDFVSFTNMKTALGLFTGTSCAAPVFAAMCALVQEFFMFNIGRKLANKELLKFIKDNCIDLFENGRDDHSGWGLFVLPDPEKIDAKKYIIEEEFDNGEIRN